MSTVYLLMAVDLNDVPTLTQKDRDDAKRDVDNLILEGLCRKKSYRTSGAVFNYVKIMPDDMPDVLRRDKLRGLPLHEQLRQAVIEYEKKSAIERWNALVARGAIDEEGNVLLKSPLMEDGDENMPEVQ